MAVSFRKNIAQKVSNVDLPEIYNWSKWIRTPLVKQHVVEVFKKIKLPDVSDLNIWIDFPLFSELEFKFDKPKLPKKLKKLQITESKINFIFFGIGTPRIKKIDTGYSTSRLDIIKPYFSIRKPEILFSHSETAWIKNLKIFGVPFSISSPAISFSHSETKWIKNIIINGVTFSIFSPEIAFTHSETKWIKNIIINPVTFSISSAETKDALIYLNETGAPVLAVEEKEELPEIIKLDIPEETVFTESRFSSPQEAELQVVNFNIAETLSDISEIRNPEAEISAMIEQIEFGIEPPGLLPVDVSAHYEIYVISDYFMAPPEVKDCISELVPQIYDIDILSAAKFAAPDAINENILQYSGFLSITSDIAAYDLNPVTIIIPFDFAITDEAEILTETLSTLTAPEIISEMSSPLAAEISDNELESFAKTKEPGSIKLKEIKTPNISGKKFIIGTPGVKAGNIKLIKYETPPEPPKPDADKEFARVAKPKPVEKPKEAEVIKEIIKPKEVVKPKEIAKPKEVEKPTAPVQPEKPKAAEKQVKAEPVVLTYKPNIETRRDFWVGIDEEQKQEYDTALSKELHQIEDLVQSGNIFRFQSKVFILLHQLKQICNFATAKASSPKSDLLMSHIEKIAKENKKAVVFSQYDKLGTQKLEQIFKKSGIKYYTFLSTATTTEIEKNLNGFRSEKNFSLLLASSKAATHRKYFGDVNYMIHFDQWWLPTTQWIIEDRAYNLDDKNFRPNQRINIFSYLSKTLIEKRIFDKMKADALNSKSIFETVSSEIINRMISDEDWMNILGIEKKEKQVLRIDEDDEDKDKKEKIETKPETGPKENPIIAIMKKLKTMEAPEIGSKVSDLFARLNYKEIKCESDSDAEYAILKASAQIKEKKISITAKCYLNDSTDIKDIQSFIEKSSKENVNKIYLISIGNLSTPLDTESSSDSLIVLTLDKLALLLHRMDLM